MKKYLLTKADVASEVPGELGQYFDPPPGYSYVDMCTRARDRNGVYILWKKNFSPPDPPVLPRPKRPPASAL